MREGQQVQKVPAVSTPAARDASRVESFRSRLQEQQKTLQSFGEKISGLVDRLKAMSEATVESRMTEVRSLREALVQLGTQLQPDAPFSQSLDQFQSWISAQMGRVNSQRATLGPEFVQELVARYQEPLALASLPSEDAGLFRRRASGGRADEHESVRQPGSPDLLVIADCSGMPRQEQVAIHIGR
jgi:hypothetical protein